MARKSPDAFHPLVVHNPSRPTQQRGYPPIAKAAVLSGEFKLPKIAAWLAPITSGAEVTKQIAEGAWLEEDS